MFHPSHTSGEDFATSLWLMCQCALCCWTLADFPSTEKTDVVSQRMMDVVP